VTACECAAWRMQQRKCATCSFAMGRYATAYESMFGREDMLRRTNACLGGKICDSVRMCGMVGKICDGVRMHIWAGRYATACECMQHARSMGGYQVFCMRVV
jgi:hypothetical protein